MPGAQERPSGQESVSFTYEDRPSSIHVKTKDKFYGFCKLILNIRVLTADEETKVAELTASRHFIKC